MFNYNEGFLKREVGGFEGGGGSDVVDSSDAIQDTSNLPEERILAIKESKEAGKEDLTKRIKEDISDLNVGVLINRGVTVKGQEGFAKLKKVLEKQGYKVSVSEYLSIIKTLTPLGTISVTGTMKGNSIELETGFNPLDNNGLVLERLSSLMDSLSELPVDAYNWIKSLFKETVKKYPSEALKAGVHIDDLPEVDLEIPKDLSVEDMLKMVREIRAEAEKKEKEALKSTEVKEKTEEPKTVESKKEKKTPKLTEAEIKAEALRKARVRKLIKEFRSIDKHNSSVTKLFKDTILKKAPTTQDEMDVFESAMGIEKLLYSDTTSENVKNLARKILESGPANYTAGLLNLEGVIKNEQKKEQEEKKQLDELFSEIKKEPELKDKISPEAKAYIDSKFKGLNNPNHAPNSKKSIKYPHGEVNPGTNLVDSVSDKIFKGDKERTMTPNELKYYNEQANKWNEVRGLVKKTNDTQPVVEEEKKQDVIGVETKENSKEQKEASNSDFIKYLEKRFKHISNLKVRTTRPQISVHGSSKNITTHPIPLEGGGVAEMTAEQVKIYNKFAARWTELRKGKVEKSSKVEEKGDESSIFDGLMNMFSSDETSAEDINLEEKIDSATNGEVSKEALDYIDKKFTKLNDPDYKPNQRKTHKEFKINSSGKQVGVITYIKVDGVRRPLNKNEISEYNKKVDEWNSRVDKK